MVINTLTGPKLSEVVQCVCVCVCVCAAGSVSPLTKHACVLKMLLMCVVHSALLRGAAGSGFILLTIRDQIPDRGKVGYIEVTFVVLAASE